MKKTRIFLIVGAINVLLSSLMAQNDTWTSFWDSDTTLIGYKDKNGIIKIEPKFISLTIAEKFDNIIAVMEEIDGKWVSYYLTKTGKIVGRDSMYIFDNSLDCESEGFIRFRDRKTDKAGMFNRNGDIAIPAEYNDLARVRNGMTIALKGAKREYLDNYQEHWRWVGGQEMLIDTLNNVLIDSFPFTIDLNFFSIEKTETPHIETIREYFMAKDGKYFSFINFEKEFRQWFFDTLLVNLTSEKLINASFDTITWSSTQGWRKTNRQNFVADNFGILKNRLIEILNPDCEYFILIDGLNPFMCNGTAFEKYFNNCGESKEWIYPVIKIVVSQKDKKYFMQNQYDFLRTDNEYKLISVTIRELKKTPQK